jgi:DNA-binding GntR family transcriptional regulator
MAVMRGAANFTSAMEVAAELRARILRGELKPGARLKIDDVATLCDVSHMPVRVALQSLEAEGIVDVYPHRGAVIKPVDAKFVRNALELRNNPEFIEVRRQIWESLREEVLRARGE